MDLSKSFMVWTFVALAVLIGLDLFLVVRRTHVPSMGEAARWVLFYIGMAVLFAVILFAQDEPAAAGQFIAGWLTEYSLSVDNLFVFVLIMTRFAVPRESQQKVLMIGILLSLVLRGGFIAVGAAAINRFGWVFYLFGAFLVYTAVQLVRGGSTLDGEYEENSLIRAARRILPLSPGYDGARLVTRIGTRTLLTPMVIVFLAIGSTDLLFAVDSIPAIFGLTKDPFIVYTATIFALMGLRQLYFLLGGLLDRLTYLSHGLAVILGFIGVKLLFEALHINEVPFINGGRHVTWAPVIPVWMSLAVIVVTLAVTTAVSLLMSRRASGATPAAQEGTPSVEDAGQPDDEPGVTAAPDGRREQLNGTVGVHHRKG